LFYKYGVGGRRPITGRQGNDKAEERSCDMN